MNLKTIEIKSEQRTVRWDAANEKEAMDLHLREYPEDRLLSLRRIGEEE